MNWTLDGYDRTVTTGNPYKTPGTLENWNLLRILLNQYHHYGAVDVAQYLTRILIEVQVTTLRVPSTLTQTSENSHARCSVCPSETRSWAAGVLEFCWASSQSPRDYHETSQKLVWLVLRLITHRPPHLGCPLLKLEEMYCKIELMKGSQALPSIRFWRVCSIQLCSFVTYSYGTIATT
jgi:hypothetical protein